MDVPSPSRAPRPQSARDARIKFSGIARYAAVYARSLVNTGCDQHLQPGELKRCADRLAVMAEVAQHYAVYYEIARHGWSAAAAGDGYALPDYLDMYEDEYGAWTEGELFPWLPAVVDRGSLPPIVDGDLEAVLAGLLAWYELTAPVGDPVSDPPTT